MINTEKVGNIFGLLASFLFYLIKATLIISPLYAARLGCQGGFRFNHSFQKIEALGVWWPLRCLQILQELLF
jgi:hypothetical protein